MNRRGFLLGLFGSAVALKAKAGMVVQPSRFAAAGGGGTPGPIPAFRSIGTVDQANAAGGSIAPGLPTGWQQNDIFLLVTECPSAETVPTPSGWQQVSASPQGNAGGGSTGSKLQVFWKRAGASESAPSVTRVGDHTIAIIAAFSGCTTSGDPVNTSAGTNGVLVASTPISIPGLTTTVGNCLVVDVVGHGIDSSTGNRFASWTNADLASPGITEAFDLAGSAGGGGGFALAYGGKATAGSVTTTAATPNSAEAYGAIKLALKPPVT